MTFALVRLEAESCENERSSRTHARKDILI